MSFKHIPRLPVGASAKRSGARLTTSRTPPIMYFQKLKRIIEEALAAHRPISYSALFFETALSAFAAIPIPHIIYYTSLSAFAGCSAILLHLLKPIIGPTPPFLTLARLQLFIPPVTHDGA